MILKIVWCGLQLCSMISYVAWVLHPEKTEFLGSAIVTGIWANTFMGG